MENLKRVWFYFREHKYLIFIALIASIVVAATDGATAYIIKDILDGIFIEKNEKMLRVIPLVIIGMYAIRGIARIMQVYLIQYSGQMAVKKIREDMYHKMIRLPMSYFDCNDTGAMMARIVNDVNNMQSAIPSVVKIVKNTLSVVFLVGVVLYQDFKLGCTIFLAMPFMVLLIVKTGKKIKKYSRKEQERVGFVATALQETFSGVRVVKAFASEDKETDKFNILNAKEIKYKLKRQLITAISSPMMETIAGFAVAAIIFYGGIKVINGETTAGTFFSFIAAFGLMFEPFKKINKENVNIQAANAAAERIFSIIDHKNDILDNDGTLDCEAEGKVIRFSDVDFRYVEDGDKILDKVNLEIKPGMTVALVGSSGAGKSTIASLIPRFYDVSGGMVSIGDVDIRDFRASSLRQNIGIVSQEPFLFNTSIRDNISYACPDATMDDIKSAAESAYALNFIEELSNGFDTVIGERGDRLSGGQKQRITIARALLLNPPILILDEATSALDTESERIVQKALTNLMEGRTSFVIAHRLSTVVNSDMIVVMDKGRVEAVGKHEELIKKSQTYANLCKLQFDPLS